MEWAVPARTWQVSGKLSTPGIQKQFPGSTLWHALAGWQISDLTQELCAVRLPMTPAASSGGTLCPST